MQLVFLHGPVAAGKLTIARLVAKRAGVALFHNHLVVDAVAAVFPFGSPEFVRLRERFWIETIEAAAREGRSLVFTFAPEPSVAPDFPERLAALVTAAGGQVLQVALTLSETEQERRLVADDRAAFGKLRSVELLRSLRPGIAACLAAMPAPDLSIDSEATSASDAADRIVAAMRAQAVDRRLATYGTLSPGRVNHHQLDGLRGGWRTGHVTGRLVEQGWGATMGFPALILDPAGERVAVHLFESPDLPDHWDRLDVFEGDGYRRVIVPVETDRGVVDAWLYEAMPG